MDIYHRPDSSFTADQPLLSIVRDNFEAKKEEFEGKIAELVGVEKFTINFNPNLVWAYAEESRSTRGYTNCGKTLAEYVLL